MNNDNFLIEESDLEQARSICKEIDNPMFRNRAVANVLAPEIARKYFTEIESEAESGLHRIPAVLRKFEISDIYVKDCYIDVRVYFENNQLCVPKIHFEKNILPIAYMFIKIDSSLTGGLVTGFLLPNNIDTSKEQDGYYYVSEEDLVSYYDIEGLLVQNYDEDTPEEFEALVFDYLDNKLDNDSGFYNALIASRYCRNILKNAANVKHIFENILPKINDTSNTDTIESSEDSQDLEMLEEAIDSSSPLELEEVSDTLEEVNLDEALDLEEFETSEPVDLEDIESTDIEDLNSVNLEEVAEFEETSENEAIDGFENTAEVGLDESVEVFELAEEVTEEQINDYEALEGFTSEDEDIALPIEEYTETIKEVEELENIEYSTNTTPSLNTIEEENIDDLEALLESSDSSILDKNEEQIFEDAKPIEEDEEENIQQIEDLFNNEAETQETFEEEFIQAPKNRSKFLPLLGTLTLVAAIGYFGYTKFVNPEPIGSDLPEASQAIQQEESTKLPTQEAMPVETVENIKPTQSANEGNAISIPAIEQNLDASILVSNLSINWEVPASYVSNNTAKRYFTKMGKIIQLNLKTELLLLSKPPITNKIALELEFNKANNKFDVKSVAASSGEKVVDDLIVQTVKNALDINLKTNMSTFGNIAGNPVLVIRL